MKHFLDEVLDVLADHPWLAESIEIWRFNAYWGDLGLHLDETWSPQERNLINDLFHKASQELERKGHFTQREANEWNVFRGQGIWFRGEFEYPAQPSVQLAKAITMLLDGELPEAPAGTWWIFGAPNGPSTIKMNLP